VIIGRVEAIDVARRAPRMNSHSSRSWPGSSNARVFVVGMTTLRAYDSHS